MLMTKKKKTAKDMDKYRRQYVKSRLDKKRINMELKKIIEEFKRISAEDPEAAKSKLLVEMHDVVPEDMFPADLEKEFNELGSENNKNNSEVVEVDDYLIPATEVIAGRHADDVIEDDLKIDAEPIDAINEEEVPDDIKLRMEEDAQIGFGDDDIFIEGGVETSSKRKLHDEE